MCWDTSRPASQRGKFARADDTLRRLRQSRLDKSRDAMLEDLAAVDSFILDDKG